MDNLEEKKTERDYHVYIGHAVPKTVAFWWIVALIVMGTYGVLHILPELHVWPFK